MAIWSGWVALGTLCGFGKVQPLPGLWDSLVIDTRVTLPIGMETYAAFALRVWLTSSPGTARQFAKLSALAALTIGAAGQVAYHLMSAAGITAAPWPVVAMVATLPVVVLGMGAALAHLHGTETTDVNAAASVPALDRPAKTARTAKTPYVQVSGPEVRHEAPANTPTGPAKTRLEAARRAPATMATVSQLAASVRALAEANPTWTQARIAAKAGCSVRTVRRHLTNPTQPDTERPAQSDTGRALESVPAADQDASNDTEDAA
ncbi:hypothetical protein [Terrabacter sp. MAHUQ-38]|uniref:hypothetical protein n=1 Tax=unclassified Terrabacter TaxID=2630222 RepID=UPI00165E4AA4|nr:hypothetical protein [Terrabacter sp. MAHUQ-38]MBC9819723.1 hypothetical protein [Terrabacter sp. MAHUQ-38]